MIYVDPSVVVAHLLAEGRCPPARLRDEHLVSSRLLEYELWNRLHSRVLAAPDDERTLAMVKGEVERLCRRFPLYPERLA